MGWKENLLVAWTFWMALTTGGGMINGWDYLTQKMDAEINGMGQLWQLCDHGDPKEIADYSEGLSCKARDDFYADVYSIAIGGMSLANLFFGLLMDARLPFMGPKMAVIVGLSTLALGNYFIGSIDSTTQSASDVKMRIYAGALCIGTGPVGTFLTAMPMVNYSKFSRVSVTAAINGVFYLSGMTYPLGFTLVVAAGVPIDQQRQLFSAIMIVVSMFNLLVSWLIWPTRPVQEGATCERLVDPAFWRLSDLREKRVSIVMKRGLITSTLTESLIQAGPDDEEKPLRERGIWGQIKTRQFLFLMVYLAYFQLSQVFFMGNADSLLVPERSWSNLLLMCQINITPMIIMVGVAWIISSLGYSVALCVTAMSSSAMFGILLIPNHGTVGNVISTSILALEMTILYTFFFTYIGGYFGYRFYGKLVGIIFLVTGIVGQLNFGLNAWATERGCTGPVVIFTLLPFLFLPLALTKRGRSLIAPPGCVKTGGDTAEESPELGKTGGDTRLKVPTATTLGRLETEHEITEDDWTARLSNGFRDVEITK